MSSCFSHPLLNARYRCSRSRHPAAPLLTFMSSPTSLLCRPHTKGAYHKASGRRALPASLQDDDRCCCLLRKPACQPAAAAPAAATGALPRSKHCCSCCCYALHLHLNGPGAIKNRCLRVQCRLRGTSNRGGHDGRRGRESIALAAAVCRAAAVQVQGSSGERRKPRATAGNTHHRQHLKVCRSLIHHLGPHPPSPKPKQR